MNVYYKVWVDCVLRLRAQKQNKNDWSQKSMIMMSLAMIFNALLFMAILQRYIVGHTFYEINMSSLSDDQNSLMTIFFLFILPCVTVNYLLIFRKKRIIKLVKKYKYPNYNGKLIAWYWIMSLLLPGVLLLIGLIIVNDATFWDVLGWFGGVFRR